MAGEIAGKWLKVKECGIKEVMEALGSDAPPEAKLVLEWVKNDDGTWTQYLTLNDVEHPQTFTSGVQYDHESFDGTPAKSTITIEGNTMSQTQIHNGKEMKVVRVFNGNKMRTTISADGPDGSTVTALNDFEKV